MKRLVSLLFLLFASACASNSDLDAIHRDINDLKKDSSETKLGLVVLKDKTSVMVKEDSFLAIRESQAEMNTRLSDFSSGFQELRGRFEEYKYNLEKTLRDSVSEREILKAQISSLESQVKAMREKLMALDETLKAKETQKKQAEETNTTTEKTPSETEEKTEPPKQGALPQPAEEKKETPEAKTKGYDTAYQAFKDRKYREAREKFEAWLKGNPRHEFADSAQFWIAETYYSEKDYESAILAYETLLKKYPAGKKTSVALLKQGFSFVELGDRKTAKTILKKLIEKFPDSKDATLAKKKMAEIEKKPHKRR